jgi:1,2-diacylglycerol 3-beta-galactosyltransferase
MHVRLQEEGNVPFVVDNQLGTFERKPAEIAKILEGWFGDKREDFLQIAQRATKIGDKWRGALFRIVGDLAAMCDAALEGRTDSRQLPACCTGS